MSEDIVTHEWRNEGGPAGVPPEFPKLQPPQKDDEIGRLGHFRILKKLGKGGMGDVYLAENTKLYGRAEAIKVPRQTDPSALERFQREEKITAMLDDDHIVTIFQADNVDGVPFMAMQLLEGESLEHRLKRKGKLSLEETLGFGCQVAKGLDHMHRRGVIHRDLKPPNIWVEHHKRRAKILDFGLACCSGETALGSRVGTPGYIPPAQAEGIRDPRNDLFGLGVVLYQMATGKTPFEGSDPQTVQEAIALSPPESPRTINPDVPEALEQLILRLLAKEAEEQPPSAADVVTKLESMTASLIRTWAWWRVALAGLAAPLLSGIVVIVVIIRDPKHREDLNPGPKGGPVTGGGLTDPKPVKNLNPNLVAANKLLSIQPCVVMVRGRNEKIKAAADLPKEPFEVTYISLSENKRVRNEDLSCLKDLKSLEHLNLHGALVTDAGLACLKGHKNLKAVFLDHTQIGDEGIAYVKDSSQNLRTLGLSFTKVTKVGLASIAPCPDLEYLDIGGVGVDDTALALFKTSKNLQDLSLNGSTAVTDAGLAAFADCPNLTRLDLGATKVTEAGLAQLKNYRSLRTLGLGNTQTTDEWMLHVEQCEKLASLDLNGTLVADKWLSQRKGLSKLKTLYLAHTQITDAGADHLKNWKGLALIDLKQTKVTRAKVKELRIALPTCTIECDGK